MRLRPFFTYYGGKWRIAAIYPPPLYEDLIEPFCGAAGYSLHYPSRRVRLYDVNPVIAGLWDYLIHATEKEIRSIPLEITDLREMDLPQEQKWLVGFWLNKACAAPRNVPSAWMRSGEKDGQAVFWGPEVRERIATQLKFIRHWKVENRHYRAAPNERATWFIDPPYCSQQGSHYTYNEVNYGRLARWINRRRGQVIVCESEGAGWLPFRPFTVARGNVRDGSQRYSKEVWYYRTDKGSGLFKNRKVNFDER